MTRMDDFCRGKDNLPFRHNSNEPDWSKWERVDSGAFVDPITHKRIVIPLKTRYAVALDIWQWFYEECQLIRVIQYRQSETRRVAERFLHGMGIKFIQFGAAVILRWAMSMARTEAIKVEGVRICDIDMLGHPSIEEISISIVRGMHSRRPIFKGEQTLSWFFNEYSFGHTFQVRGVCFSFVFQLRRIDGLIRFIVGNVWHSRQDITEKSMSMRMANGYLVYRKFLKNFSI